MREFWKCTVSNIDGRVSYCSAGKQGGQSAVVIDFSRDTVFLGISIAWLKACKTNLFSCRVLRCYFFQLQLFEFISVCGIPRILVLRSVLMNWSDFLFLISRVDLEVLPFSKESKLNPIDYCCAVCDNVPHMGRLLIMIERAIINQYHLLMWESDPFRVCSVRIVGIMASKRQNEGVSLLLEWILLAESHE